MWNWLSGAANAIGNAVHGAENFVGNLFHPQAPPPQQQQQAPPPQQQQQPQGLNFGAMANYLANQYLPGLQQAHQADLQAQQQAQAQRAQNQQVPQQNPVQQFGNLLHRIGADVANPVSQAINNINATNRQGLQQIGNAAQAAINPAENILSQTMKYDLAVFAANQINNMERDNPQLAQGIHQTLNDAGQAMNNVASGYENLPVVKQALAFTNPENFTKGGPADLGPFNQAAQLITGVPRMYAEIPAEGIRALAGYGPQYAQDLLSQGTNNPTSAQDAIKNIAATTSHAFNALSPVAGVGTIAEAAGKSMAEQSLVNKAASGAAQGALAGAGFAAPSGFLQGAQQGNNISEMTQNAAQQGAQGVAQGAVVGGILGGAGGAISGVIHPQTGNVASGVDDIPVIDKSPKTQAPEVQPKRIADMNEQELRDLATKNDITGLPSGLMLREAVDTGAHNAYSSLDVTGLTHFNKYGTGAGDQLLQEVGKTMQETAQDHPEVGIYHPHGDEFYAGAKNQAAADAYSKDLTQRLANKVFTIEDSNGKMYEVKGVQLNYGIGHDIKSSDAAMQGVKEGEPGFENNQFYSKAARRARGEAPSEKGAIAPGTTITPIGEQGVRPNVGETRPPGQGLPSGQQPREVANSELPKDNPLYISPQNEAKINARQEKLSVGQDKSLETNVTQKQRIIDNYKQNPMYGKPQTKLAPVREGDWKQTVLNGQAAYNLPQDYKALVNKAAKNMSSNDIQLLDQLHGNNLDAVASKAENEAQFRAVATAMKKANDAAHAMGVEAGQTVPYRTEYGSRMMWDTSDKETADKLAQYQKAKLAENPGYSKERTIPSYEEGEKLGLKRLNNNSLEDFNMDMDQRSSQLRQLAVWRGLSKAFPNKVAFGEIGRDPQTGELFKQLDIPGAKGVSASPEIADMLNTRAPAGHAPGIWGTIGKAYDSLNGFLKGTRLALGGFHDVATMEGYVGTQTTPMKILKGETGLSAPMRAKVDPGYFAEIQKNLLDNGDITRMRQAGLTFSHAEVAADAGGSVLLKGKYNPIRVMHDSLFGREIPLAKQINFLQATKDLDMTTPEGLAKARDVANSLNAGFGGINRAVEGLTPKEAHIASKFLLATDYNEGQAKTLIRSFYKGGPAGAASRQILASKIALSAIPGMIGFGLAGGGNIQQWANQVVSQIVDPHINLPIKNSKGEQVTLKLAGSPAITKVYRAVAPFFNNPGDKFSGLVHEATGNLAALPGSINMFANNKDYYGNQIIKKDAQGNINIPQSAINSVTALSPIPLNQLYRGATGQQSPLETALNVVGLGRTATSPDDPKYQQSVAHYQHVSEAKAGLDSAGGQAIDDYLAAEQTPDGKNIIKDQNESRLRAAELAKPQNDQARLALQMAMRKDANHDPMWDLNPDQLKTYLQYESQVKDSPEQLATKKLNPWIQDIQTQRSDFYNGLAKSGNSVYSPTYVHDPLTQDEHNLMSQASHITDTTAKSQFYQQHPELIAINQKYGNYVNQVRQLEGAPPLPASPQADPAIQQYLNQYMAADKASRMAMRVANPGAYGAMQGYLTQVSVNDLLRNASVDQLTGGQLSQKSLKDIYNLGQYDVVKNQDGSYALGSSFGKSGGSGGSGGSRSAYSRTSRTPHIRMPNIKPPRAPQFYSKPSRLSVRSAANRAKARSRQTKIKIA